MHLNALWESKLVGAGASRGGRAVLLVLAVCALFGLGVPPAALASERIALVVGNSRYRNVPELTNPDNDARLMARTLRSLGFKLVGGGAQLDLDKQQFDSVAQEFGGAAQGADVALFYYAGHGVQIHGTNYLVPVSADPHRQADVFFQMLDADLVLQEMESSGARLKVMVLDACRNNPFRRRGFRAIGGGLAQMQAPVGTFISFATQPGEEALDGTSGHSPYTAALAKVMRKAGLNIFSTFNEVGLEVAHATNGQQRPWLSSSPINGDFYFAGPAKPDAAVEQADAYKAAKSLNSKEGWDAFLNHYKKGFYVDLARAQRDNILAKERAQAATQARQRAEAEAVLTEARREAAAAKATQLAAEKQARGAAAKSAAEKKAAKEVIAKAGREAAAEARQRAEGADLPLMQSKLPNGAALHYVRVPRGGFDVRVLAAHVPSLQQVASNRNSNPEHAASGYPLREYLKRFGALAVLSGGFIDSYSPPTPLGLVRSNGVQFGEIHHSWLVNGFFCSDGLRVKITAVDKDPIRRNFRDCVQSGPLLLLGAKTPNDPAQQANANYRKFARARINRTFACITGKGETILGLTDKIDLPGLVVALSKPEFDCRDAIAFTGAVSAGLIVGHTLIGKDKFLFPSVVAVLPKR